jgi:hypothetical protein
VFTEQTESSSVQRVLGRRDVFEIDHSVVSLVTVNVIDVHASRGWAEESLRDESMYAAGFPEDSDQVVAGAKSRMASRPQDTSGLNSHTANFTTDASEVRCRVDASQTRNRTPLLIGQVAEDRPCSVGMARQILTAPASLAVRPSAASACAAVLPNPRSIRTLRQAVHCRDVTSPTLRRGCLLRRSTRAFVHRVFSTAAAHLYRERPPRTTALNTPVQLHGAMISGGTLNGHG